MLRRVLNTKLLSEVWRRGMHYSRASKEDRCEILQVVKESFIRNEPSAVITGVSKIRNLSEGFQQFLEDSVDEEYCIVGRNTDIDPCDSRIACLGVGTIRPIELPQNHYYSYIKNCCDQKEKNLLEVWQFLDHQPENFCELYPLHECCFDIKYVHCGHELKDKATICDLVTLLLTLAEELELKLVRAGTTNADSAMACENAAMKSEFCLEYLDYQTPCGDCLFQKELPPHYCMKVYTKEIITDKCKDAGMKSR